MYDFVEPQPLPTTNNVIREIALGFKKKYNFQKWHNIAVLIRGLNGSEITVGRGRDNDISCVIYGRGKFIIIVPNTLIFDQYNFFLAKQLGHYVLHSDMGKKRTMFLNWNDNNVQLEYQANVFAKILLDRK